MRRCRPTTMAMENRLCRLAAVRRDVVRDSDLERECHDSAVGQREHALQRQACLVPDRHSSVVEAVLNRAGRLSLPALTVIVRHSNENIVLLGERKSACRLR